MSLRSFKGCCCPLYALGTRIFATLCAAQGWTVQLMVKRAGLAMPEFAADAGRFRPERWLGEDGRPIKDPKGFMPFGEGPRKYGSEPCISANSNEMIRSNAFVFFG